MKKVSWLGAIAFLGVAIGMLYLPTFHWLWDEWFRTGVRFYSHGLLVFLISSFLVWRKRQVFTSASPYLKGIPLVLLGLGLGIVAPVPKLPLLYTYSLSAYSLIVLVIGVLLVVGGKKVIAQLLFPLLFLTLAVPFPFANQVASSLAKIVATGSVALAEATGLPIAREGTLVVVGGNSYSIDALCSSLNMILALFTLVLPVLYLKHVSRVKNAIFLLGVPVVALVFKILLVTSVFWMTQRVGQEAAVKAYHGWAGMLTFGLSLLVVLLPILLLVNPRSWPTLREVVRQPAVFN